MNPHPQHPLDNPIWNALTGHQQGLAVRTGNAATFPPTIGPLTGLSDPTPEAFQDLTHLKGEGGLSILFLDQKLQDFTAPWTLVREGPLTQMVLEEPFPEAPGIDLPIVPLGDADIPDMMALTQLTQPGPFFERTLDLGGYIGIKNQGRLVAMAGQRLHVASFREISAVCTHPDFQGRGYAKALMIAVAQGMIARGETPFLHAWADNHGAIAVYEKLGFRRRRFLELSALRWNRPSRTQENPQHTSNEDPRALQDSPA